MDGFTYHDIFQTKGIEYLIIIGFLLLLIPFWVVINRKSQIIARLKNALGALTLDILRIPGGIFFSKYHTWAYLEKTGVASVGPDDLLLHLTGDVEYRNFKSPGDEIRKGELITEVLQDGKALRLHSPISGRIVSQNPEPLNPAELLEGDLYGNGWAYRIEPSDWKAETSMYYIGKEAERWFRQELDRFKDFMAVTAASNRSDTSQVVYQEGGELRDQILSSLSVEVWQDFQKEFLDD